MARMPTAMMNTSSHLMRTMRKRFSKRSASSPDQAEKRNIGKMNSAMLKLV